MVLNEAWSGHENMCSNVQVTGVSDDGGKGVHDCSGGRADLWDTLQFSADHSILPEIQTHPLEDVQDVFPGFATGPCRAVLF